MHLKRILLLSCIVASSLCFSTDKDVAFILTPKGKTGALEENKLVVKKFYTSFLNNDWNDMSPLLTQNYQIEDADTLHNVTQAKFPAMAKDMKQRLKAYHSAFPEFTLTVDEMIAEGNKVFARISLTGVQKGTYLGIAPTGNTIRFKIFSILTLSDDQISHITELWNEYSVMKQLGYLML